MALICNGFFLLRIVLLQSGDAEIILASQISPGGMVMEIRFDTDGSMDPSNQTHLVVAEVQEDGRKVRHFLCLRCRELLESEDGEASVHTCQGGDTSGQ